MGKGTNGRLEGTLILQEIEIHFEKKTTMEEMEKYGLEYSIHGSQMRYLIPDALREKIIKYIDKGGQLEIEDKCLIKEIADYFTEEQLMKDEISKLDEYQNVLSCTLQKEVLRQKQAGNKDREALLEVYRSIVTGYEKETFGVVAGESRPYRLANKCLDEAEEMLGVSKED